MNEIFISIIIPVYNRKNELSLLLDSLANQTHQKNNFEIIVVDDGSKNENKIDINKYKNIFKNFKYIEQKNQGPGIARNTGVENSSGNYLAFIDSDCVAKSNWLEEVDKILNNNKVYAMHGAVISDIPAIDPFVHTIIRGEFPIVTTNLIIEKSAFYKVGKFDPVLSYQFEDWDIVWRLQKIYGKIFYEPKAIIEHPPVYQSYFKSLKYLKYSELTFYVLRKHPDLPFLDDIKHLTYRVLLKSYHLIVWALLPIPLPILIKIILGISNFWLLDIFRILKKCRILSRHKWNAKFIDIILYILFNWFTDFRNICYVIKGFYKYRKVKEWNIN